MWSIIIDARYDSNTQELMIVFNQENIHEATPWNASIVRGLF